MYVWWRCAGSAHA